MSLLSRTVALILLATSPVTSALAENECSGARNQREINACYTNVYQQADRALQSTYDSLRKKLLPESAAKLRDAQRTWVAYKESWCDLQTTAVKNGTMYPTVLAQCLTEITNQQRERLAHQNTCEEDVDCLPKK